ncbi:LapA family protein [Streptomyces graminilatus]|uniref:LapA family protein n=1 Tax=Streptomyces graminilatus TaxID=1464070 RepID=UPI0006E1300E|nr:LapA family protein [Streptomyces graminilatus]
MSPKTSESGGKAGGGTGGGTGGARGLLTPGRATVGALAVLALIFIFENTRATMIRLLIPEVTMPLWMALLGTAVIGALCGAYFMRRRR